MHGRKNIKKKQKIVERIFMKCDVCDFKQDMSTRFSVR